MYKSFEDKIRFYESKIRAGRANFIFLKDSSMVYDYDRFNSAEDAIVDAVKNHGEDLDDMISMCYSQTNSHLKEFFLEELKK